MECAVRDCTNPASVYPVLQLWAKGYDPDSHEPAELEFRELGHCAMCRRTTQAAALLGAPQRARLDQEFARLKLAPPDYEAARLRWQPLRDTN